MTVRRAAGGGAAGGGGWVLGLAEGGQCLDLGFGPGGWTTAEGGDGMPPAAVSAGWTGVDVLTATVRFLETPHSLEVRCVLSEGEFTAAWRTRPLHPGPLHRMLVPGA